MVLPLLLITGAVKSFVRENPEPDIFIVPLELSHRKTVYALAGDYFPAIWAAYLAFSTFYALGAKRRKRRLAKSL